MVAMKKTYLFTIQLRFKGKKRGGEQMETINISKYEQFCKILFNKFLSFCSVMRNLFYEHEKFSFSYLNLSFSFISSIFSLYFIFNFFS